MTTARAIVAETPGQLVVRDVQLTDPAPGEVLVRVDTTGICHTDISWASGAVNDRFPVIPGHETSGVVEAVGSAVTRFAPGDRVVAALSHHCGHCYYCESGHPMLCVERTIDHPRVTDRGEHVLQGFGVGGFSTHILVGESSLVSVPDDVPLDVAALVGCAIATGLGSVFTIAQVRPGSRSLVIGAGGIGLSVLMGLHTTGAEQIVVIEPDAARREHALRLGATDALAPGDDRLHSLTDDGFDYAFETAGLTSTIEDAIQLARPGGTIVLIGAPAAHEHFRVPALDFVATQKRLLGCITGDLSPVSDFDRYFRMYARGMLPLDDLVSGTATLDEAAELLSSGVPAGSIRILVHP